MCIFNCFVSNLLQDMDSWYKTKFEDLTNKTTRHVGKVRSIREEITGARREVSNKLDNLLTNKLYQTG